MLAFTSLLIDDDFFTSLDVLVQFPPEGIMKFCVHVLIIHAPPSNQRSEDEKCCIRKMVGGNHSNRLTGQIFTRVAVVWNCTDIFWTHFFISPKTLAVVIFGNSCREKTTTTTRMYIKNWWNCFVLLSGILTSSIICAETFSWLRQFFFSRHVDKWLSEKTMVYVR